MEHGLRLNDGSLTVLKQLLLLGKEQTATALNAEWKLFLTSFFRPSLLSTRKLKTLPHIHYYTKRMNAGSIILTVERGFASSSTADTQPKSCWNAYYT